MHPPRQRGSFLGCESCLPSSPPSSSPAGQSALHSGLLPPAGGEHGCITAGQSILELSSYIVWVAGFLFFRKFHKGRGGAKHDLEKRGWGNCIAHNRVPS